MTDQLTSSDIEETVATAPARSDMTVDLVIDSYRVTGELLSNGGPPRLVDILNISDESFVTLRDGCWMIR